MSEIFYFPNSLNFLKSKKNNSIFCAAHQISHSKKQKQINNLYLPSDRELRPKILKHGQGDPLM